MLRWILIVYGVLALSFAIVLLILRVTPILVIYIGANALLLLGGLLLERSKYRPRLRGVGTWQATSERFVDPVSGRHVEVYFNPQTGERDYRDADSGEQQTK